MALFSCSRARDDERRQFEARTPRPRGEGLEPLRERRPAPRVVLAREVGADVVAGPELLTADVDPREHRVLLVLVHEVERPVARGGQVAEALLQFGRRLEEQLDARRPQRARELRRRRARPRAAQPLLLEAAREWSSWRYRSADCKIYRFQRRM